MRHASRLFACVAASLVAGGASAAEPACYDLKVLATPTTQIPTKIPDDPDVLIMTWPWFVDLEVVGIAVPRSVISALSVQHSELPHEPRTWFLRRNTAGSFNVLRVADLSSVLRCAATAVPAPPYLQPKAGESLDDVRRESEAWYRRDAEDGLE